MARRLTRDPRNAVLGGVAAGLADYFDVDPVIVRIGFVLLCLASGIGLVVYLVAWVVVPRRDVISVGPSPPETPPVDRVVDQVREAGEKVVDGLHEASNKEGRGRIIAGSIMIGLGLLFLLDRISWFYWPDWLRLSRLWPVALIVVGIMMIGKIGWGGARSEER